MMQLKSILRRSLQAVGYTVERYNPNAPNRDCVAEQKRLIHSELGRKVIFDVGAHQGAVTEGYRSQIPEATVYSVEPSPEAFAVLEKRFENDAAVHPIRAAISDTCGTRKFFSYRFQANNSLLSAHRDVEDFVQGGLFERQSEYEVQTLTIDSICQSNGIEKVSILKMDIQGGELDALKGARRMLEEGRISLIYSEVCFVQLYEGQPLFHHLCDYLEDCAYSLYDIYSPVHRQGQILWADAIFLGTSAKAAWKDQVLLP
jgi:FkbM family methyltransferase